MPPHEPRPDDVEIGSWVASLLAVVQGKDRVLVLTHDNPDPDAMAAASGLAELFERGFGVKADLAYGGIIGRAENQALKNVLHLPLVPVSRIDAEGAVLALVDTQPEAGNHPLPRGVEPDIVVDHHPDRQGQPDRKGGPPVSIVSGSFGATSSIVTHLLRVAGLEPSVELATALFYGVKTDTRSLGREAELADIEAWDWLVRRADPELLARIEHPAVPREYFRAYSRAYQRALLYDRVVMVDMGLVYIPDIVPEVAERLVSPEDCKWSLAMGEHENALFISIRTNDRRMNAGKRVRDVVAFWPGATAGGHGQMAGARVPLLGLGPRARRRVCRMLLESFRQQFGVADVEPQRLTV